ncbi:MAG: lipopolysaccharide heptosyltransferase II [Candidatus Pacebacteria bacterium]|nr:lipopolysaccharide heptosyltransferase II [Candidatus Paceibacterota bacterium]
MRQKYIVKDRAQRCLTKAIDIVGNIFFSFFHIFCRGNRELSNIKKILVIRIDGIGDVVLSTPAIRLLKEKFPQAHISVLVLPKSKEVLEFNPFINKIIICDYDLLGNAWQSFTFLKELIKITRRLKEERYDLGIDLRADFTNILIMFFANIKYRVSQGIRGGNFLLTHNAPYKEIKHEMERDIDVLIPLNCHYSGALRPEIFVIEKDKALAKSLLQKNGITPKDLLIGFHCGAPWEYRAWPKERFAQLADQLIDEYCCKIVIIGGKGEEKLAKEIINLMKHQAVNLTGKLNLRSLAFLIQKMDLFICNDGGPMNIASTTNTPVIALFGPQDPRRFCPFGNTSVFIHKKTPCSPCNQTVCKLRPTCMERITVKEVFNKATSILSRISMLK